jgi:hypothetical protein
VTTFVKPEGWDQMSKAKKRRLRKMAHQQKEEAEAKIQAEEEKQQRRVQSRKVKTIKARLHPMYRKFHFFLNGMNKPMEEVRAQMEAAYLDLSIVDDDRCVCSDTPLALVS